MRVAKAATLALLMWATALPAHAKCAFTRYVVEGRVLLPQGISADHVRVYLFVEGMNRASDYPGSAAKPDFGVLDTDGRFRVESWVSTASGDPDSRTEQCKRAETAGEGLYARRARVTFGSGRREILKKHEASARLGPIEVERLPQE
jgi:hypothetical protein